MRQATTHKVVAAATVVIAGIVGTGCGNAASKSGLAARPKPGAYSGTTSQGLPISFVVGRTGQLSEVRFGWRARCADGQMHVNTIALGGGTIRHGRFSTRGRLYTGGVAEVTGRVDGANASGILSRRKGSAFGTTCRVVGIHWHARTRPRPGSTDSAV